MGTEGASITGTDGQRPDQTPGDAPAEPTAPVPEGAVAEGEVTSDGAPAVDVATVDDVADGAPVQETATVGGEPATDDARAADEAPAVDEAVSDGVGPADEAAADETAAPVNASVADEDAEGDGRSTRAEAEAEREPQPEPEPEPEPAPVSGVAPAAELEREPEPAPASERESASAPEAQATPVPEPAATPTEPETPTEDGREPEPGVVVETSAPESEAPADPPSTATAPPVITEVPRAEDATEAPRAADDSIAASPAAEDATEVLPPAWGDEPAPAPGTAPGWRPVPAARAWTSDPEPRTPVSSTPAAAAPPVGAAAPTVARASVADRTRPAAEDRAEAPARSPLDVFEEDARPRRWPRVLATVLGVLVVLAGAYVGAAWLLSDRVPSGATVAGVEIGGLTEAEAVDRLRSDLVPVAEGELPVAAGEKRTVLDPAAAGLELDVEATVEPLVGFGLEPVRLWRQVFGMQDVAPVTVVDEPRFDTAFASLEDALRAEPVDGTVVFVDGEPQSTAAEDGLEVDPEPGRATLLDGWLTAARPLELPTRTIEPDITDSDVELAMREIARPFAAAPITVAVEGQLAQLPVDVTTAAAEVVPQDGRLELRLDGQALAEAVLARTTDLLVAAEDAHFAFVDGAPTIVPGTPGKTLDPEALAEAVAQAGTGADRTATVELVELDPERTTAALEALGVKEKIAEFSTGSLGTADRVHNLTLGASKVNGTLLLPGEVFSLNDTLAPITREGGYRGASVVVNGVLQEGVGGGLSQMGTTVYNAGFFAGLEDVEHRPHSYYFSRYPEGREATIYGDVLDVKIGNNTPYGVLFQSWVANGRLHVALWSTKHWEVEHSTSGRSNVVQPRTIYDTRPGCISQGSGSPGFSVTVRRVLKLDGEVKHEESNSWRYQPQNRIVCGPEPTPDPAPPPPEG